MQCGGTALSSLSGRVLEACRGCITDGAPFLVGRTGEEGLWIRASLSLSPMQQPASGAVGAIRKRKKRHHRKQGGTAAAAAGGGTAAAAISLVRVAADVANVLLVVLQQYKMCSSSSPHAHASHTSM